MTAKRFRLEVEDDMYYTIFDNQSTDEEDKLYGLDDEQIVDLLNELHEENQHLKKELFEAKKDYLIETSDEVDKALYVDDRIEELRKELLE